VKRNQVVEKAAELFDAAGYHSTGVADIAAAAGISKPTLYHYFAGKDEILFWIHEEFINLLIEQAESRAGKIESAGAELGRVIQDVLELMETHRGHVRVFFEHHRELAPKQQKTIKAKRDQYQAIVQEIIERGIKSGEFRKIDARLATLAVFGSCNWAYQWFRADGTRTPKEIATVFADLFARGLQG
jgi:AcrR family transcriptional regulator